MVLCDTTLMAVYDALNATYPQTNPQAVDNLGQSNTKYRARVGKKEPGALSGAIGGLKERSKHRAFGIAVHGVCYTSAHL